MTDPQHDAPRAPFGVPENQAAKSHGPGQGQGQGAAHASEIPASQRDAVRDEPRYAHPPKKVDGKPFGRVTLELIENLFFGLVMVLVLIFGVLLLRLAHSPWAVIGYLIVFWVAMAYLALPRLHRILSAMYVPNYFFGRTRTNEGLLGDPVNLAVTGSADQIHEAMERAGWVRADPVTLGTSIRIVTSSITRKSYQKAPVSPLFLFDRMQDFTYQKEVAGNPAQRHHVRFWRCPEGWLLPGGSRVDWLAAGTYDRAVGFSLFTFQVTHKIDRNIDVERDYVIATVLHTEPRADVRVIEDFSTGYHSRNGGGDAVQTDGDLPVLELGRIPVSRETSAPSAAPESLLDRAMNPAENAHPSSPIDVIGEVARRPFSIVAAWLLTLLSALMSIGTGILEVLNLGPSGELAGLTGQEKTITTWIVLSVVLAVYGTVLVLGWFTFRGSIASRLISIVLIAGNVAVEVIFDFQSTHVPALTLISTSIDLLVLYALTSRSAREWTGRKRIHAASGVTECFSPRS